MQAAVLAGGLGLFASFKTAVHFISSPIATVEVMAWYQVTDVTHDFNGFLEDKVFAVRQRWSPANWRNHCVTSVK